MLDVVKAHAYGNDFLLVRGDAASNRVAAALARAMCDRQTGIGADGLILYRPSPDGAQMWLRNADGSRSEVSGNGVRCLAAWLVEAGLAAPDSEDPVIIQTDAGAKTLWPTGQEGRRRFFRAAMGAPSGVRRERVQLCGEELAVVTVSVGNPHCVLLGEASEARLHAYGFALATHPSFPEGTNVEFAEVEAPGTVRIVIWERGVGPTRASGTGACAAAVAAAAFGGATRDVEVVSPGGAQRVEWRDDGIYLTGWAEVIVEGRWLSMLPDQVMA